MNTLQFLSLFLRDFPSVDPHSVFIAFFILLLVYRIFDLVKFILVLREARRGRYTQVQYKKWVLLKK